MPYIIYADFEFLIKKIEGCANNSDTSSTIKVGKIFLVDIQCQQSRDLGLNSMRTCHFYLNEKNLKKSKSL